MPQMGESIAEGTIVRWIKKVGDQVDRDEPLFEITTDKVDAEIPSPAAGILTEITAREGETVSVNTVVGTIQLEGEGPTEAAAPLSASEQSAGSTPIVPVPAGETTASGSAAPVMSGGAPSDDGRRQRSSPLVRRIAREHAVDITRITGSGVSGRVTKRDILEYLGRDSMNPPGGGLASPESQVPIPGASDRVEIQPLSVIRRTIAERMVLSQRTSAHVHSVFHVDFSDVQRIRHERNEGQAEAGSKLSYLAFIALAVVGALRRHPILNASLDGHNIVYRKDVNLGIAVALDSGLIVPVIKEADTKNLLDLSRAIADVATRARAKQLKPDEVHGGTFTITNPGQFGAQFGMPIINQPQVAILGVGTIEKRPVVVDDRMVIRTMAYLTLGFDHRLIDGAVADQFMADVKQHIEQFDANQAPGTYA